MPEHRVKEDVDVGRPRAWVNGQIATGRRFIPNVPVVTHLGERRMFYDDLVKDRTVLVQFLSLAGHDDYPVTRNLVRLQHLLGDRLGRDVFLYSITVDPVHDGVEAISRFAERHGAGPGWLFLTGEEPALTALKGVFFVHAGGHHQHQAHGHGAHAGGRRPAPPPDCSIGLMRYGNDALGLWGSVPTKSDPALIVEKLSWIQPRSHRDEAGPRLTRRGPMRPV